MVREKVFRLPTKLGARSPPLVNTVRAVLCMWLDFYIDVAKLTRSKFPFPFMNEVKSILN